MARYLQFIAAFLIAAGPAQAATTSFGADLSQAADSTGTCAMMLQSSCTFYSGAPGPSFYAPASGTITAVRVKTGAVTGPMQIVVMRSLFQNRFGDPGHPYFACCFVEQYGPVFTPTANSVTTVPTSLQVVEDPVPPATDILTSARGDFLALSVLAADVPVPAHFDNASVFAGIAPAPTPQTFPAPSPNPLLAATNGVGYQILMNADMDSGGTSGGPTAPTTTPPTPAPTTTPPATPPAGTNTPVPPAPTQPLRIATSGQLLGNVAAIPLTCALATACNGVLKLAAGSASYGTSRYSIAAGRQKTVKVKLNALGRRKLAKRKSATLSATTAIAGKTVSGPVRLKRRQRTSGNL